MLNFYTNGPADRLSTRIQCYKADAKDHGTVTTLLVSAGPQIGFVANGVLDSPDRRASTTWQKCQRRADDGYVTDSQVLSIKIPACISSGEYLARVEHLALHGAAAEAETQLYLACAQVSVWWSGNTSPSGLVSFPGAYKSTDPGILFQAYVLAHADELH
ncbi:glycosyl hydrolase family 61 [Colletotrichum orchidophilum]|uniref:lytic cellulose monooxygenase (C4-dehydrogenating) n=1 Tax=Colletotrichum orchidophilum TaxID=1209926 RepID=A0A1G4B3N1_9PEZI|nr:glycosyl hydrolase family 61 [Colletotrichum orchidophilum]OHE95976.1 glycosyl hydrolase family 61 [Colletotrichum orchidophilum]